MKGQLLFLGTGASVGVPIIGCTCPVCTSTSALNKRLRSSVLIQLNRKQYLIDAGPDLRQQALTYQIKTLDGVLITHAHHDHTAGMDDLRPFSFNTKKPLPILLSKETAADIQSRYYYLFPANPQHSRLQLNILPAQEGDILFEGIPIHYMTYEQAGMKVNGFRFGNLAYLSDIRSFSPSIFEQLVGVDILVISALRYASSELHFSVEEAVQFITQAQAKSAWLTHISHELEHHQTNASLSPHIKLAYDGLKIDFEVPNLE